MPLAHSPCKAVVEPSVVAAACPVHDDVRVVGEWDTPQGLPGGLAIPARTLEKTPCLVCAPS